MRGWRGSGDSCPLHLYSLYYLIYPRHHSELTVQACLNFLLAKGVAVEEIRADEIHEGNMKAGGDTRDNTDLDMCFFMTKGEHTFLTMTALIRPLISFSEHLWASPISPAPVTWRRWRVYLCSWHLRVNICTTLSLSLVKIVYLPHHEKAFLQLTFSFLTQIMQCYDRVSAS